MSTTQELIERLRDVGTIKSDDAYDGVDPRVVRAMRKVTEVMHEAADRLSELSAELEALKAENAKLREALMDLGKACSNYRHLHDRLGGDHIDTGRAWDEMRRAENAALGVFHRSALGGAG